MTMNEARAQVIAEWTTEFKERANFPEDIAKQAAADVVDKGWTYERTYRKYKKQMMIGEKTE